MSNVVDTIFPGAGTAASSILKGKTTTTSVNVPPPTPEELELVKINTELARKQLANIDQLQPFQKELLDLTLANLRRQGVLDEAMSGAITPEMQAAAAKADFERSQRMGPIQDEMVKLQLDALRQGGKATPEQLAAIKDATDAGIAAGTSDIDASTGRGIGLIADELANSRGLRLSDSPISSEAALLAREGEIQKGSLIKNLRAGQAQAALNYPLAVGQLQGGMNLGQQNLLQSASNFQNDLRARAYQNRLAMTGTAASSGIGLAGIGNGTGTLNTLTSARYAGATRTENTPFNLTDLAAMAQGVGALARFSDRRLKKDYGVVARTGDGIDLHVFQYKWEGERDPLRLGVMADEVERVTPSAVRTHPSGYKIVRYDMIR